MALDEVVQALCDGIAASIGAVVCDYEGETVVSANGRAGVPQGAVERALSQLPRTMQSAVSSREFLLRVVGAEPCGLLRSFGERAQARGVGALDGFEARFAEVDLLVRRLPEDYYVVLALRRPCVMAIAREKLDKTVPVLAEYIA